jgi:hypothetical protein
MGLYGAMSSGTINMMRNLAKAHTPALGGERPKPIAGDSLNNKIQKVDSTFIESPVIDTTRKEK